MVLGVDWLQATNPTIDWWSYTVALPVHGESQRRVVSGLPVGPVADVQLCSLQQARRAVKYGAESFTVLLSALTTGDAMEA